ncbi:hypothetical protein [Novosphingobium humi]|uniref:DUF3077 domain-containing protein n=1 Tax=Novosphingobium humi TaxID=2282397 RepID=A0ABY7TW41_9SPHN|nr:hypothetical protein [Novosphingobium humi]WCT76334.1 hypothetical protein PQ457_10260 [Novosphingobium humi]
MADLSLRAKSAQSNVAPSNHIWGLDDLAASIKAAANLAFAIAQDSELHPYQVSALAGLEAFLETLADKAMALDAGAVIARPLKHGTDSMGRRAHGQ